MFEKFMEISFEIPFFIIGTCGISWAKGSKYDTGRVVRIWVSVSTVPGGLFKHHSRMTFGLITQRNYLENTARFFIAEIFTNCDRFS